MFIQTDHPNVVELRITSENCRETSDYCLELNGPPGERFKQFRAAFDALSPSVAIHVRINCKGGHFNIAIGLNELLRGCRGRVVTSIERVAWSTGAIISQAGSVRRMAADAIFCAHRCRLALDLSVVPSGLGMFPAGDLRKYADILDQADEELVRIFAGRTGRSASDVWALLDADDCMTAREAKAWGLIDEITPAIGGTDIRWEPHLVGRVSAARGRAANGCERV